MSRTKFFKTGLIVFLFLVAIAAEVEVNEIHGLNPPQVKLGKNAILSGKEDSSRAGQPFSSFTGVKYATVKERFEEAEPNLEPTWEGVQNATGVGAKCLQVYPGEDPKNSTVLGEEDCLNLNVYVPSKSEIPGGGYPVMVFIHGGSLILGAGIEFGPKFFMDEEVILVTINYRLGPLGFLSTGEDGIIPGNLGYKDQILALKWVQHNIEKFGGNPEKVTLFGEDAGSVAVHLLMMSPSAQGLFQRAISQSGTAMEIAAYFPNPKPRESAVKLATYFNCSGDGEDPSKITSEEIKTCLKEKNGKELTAAQLVVNPSWAPCLGVPWGPVKEAMESSNPFLTELPLAKLLTENSSLFSSNNIPWLVGMTKDDIGSVLATLLFFQEKIVKQLNTDWDKVAEEGLHLKHFPTTESEKKAMMQKIKKFYFKEGQLDGETDWTKPENKGKLARIFNDGDMFHSTRKAALLEGAKGRPTYLFEYDHVGPKEFSEAMGFPPEEGERTVVAHGDELFLQFNMEDWLPINTTKVIGPGSKDYEFSKALIKLWVSFAKDGKPSHQWDEEKSNKLSEQWQPVSKEEVEGTAPLKWFRLKASNPGHLVEDDDVRQRALFWEKLYSQHIEPVVLAEK